MHFFNKIYHKRETLYRTPLGKQYRHLLNVIKGHPVNFICDCRLVVAMVWVCTECILQRLMWYKFGSDCGNGRWLLMGRASWVVLRLWWVNCLQKALWDPSLPSFLFLDVISHFFFFVCALLLWHFLATKSSPELRWYWCHISLNL